MYAVLSSPALLTYVLMQSLHVSPEPVPGCGGCEGDGTDGEGELSLIHIDIIHKDV